LIIFSQLINKISHNQNQKTTIAKFQLGTQTKETKKIEEERVEKDEDPFMLLEW